VVAGKGETVAHGRLDRRFLFDAWFDNEYSPAWGERNGNQYLIPKMFAAAPDRWRERGKT
jgi:hypothetical protein